MKIAVVHPHYRRGGVTRVVENAAAALASSGVELLALSGETETAAALPQHRPVAGLGYTTEARPGEAEALAGRLRDTAREAFGSAPDLWHFHNHSLGKNVHLPAALRLLVEDGARVLLQIHDFAEDGRPTNYAALRTAYPHSGTFAAALYPDAPQVHFAVLNGRDAGVLRSAGIPSDRCHLLPNPIAVPSLEAGEDGVFPDLDRLILYPTRAIRRKNVGEMLLHAALAPAGTRFGTTLRPENPEWTTIHDHWEKAAQRLRLPVAFGLGESHAFDALVRRADALITTSVAEGFGLAFLEPALFGKPLVGRNLPAITDDFRAWGITLDQLYTALPIPRKRIDQTALRQHTTAALERLGRAYARPYRDDAVEEALAAMRVGHDALDFGRLDEDLQTAVIESAVADPDPFVAVAQSLKAMPTQEKIAADQRAIAEHLSLPGYGERLQTLYSQVTETASGAVSAFDAPAVLEAFLDPRQLFLLRS